VSFFLVTSSTGSHSRAGLHVIELPENPLFSKKEAALCGGFNMIPPVDDAKKVRELDGSELPSDSQLVGQICSRCRKKWIQLQKTSQVNK